MIATPIQWTPEMVESFIAVWNSAETRREVADQFEITPECASVVANRFRQRGHELKRMARTRTNMKVRYETVARHYYGLSRQDFEARVERGLKRCSRCREWLSRALFTMNNRRPDGMSAYCRPCDREYRIERGTTSGKRPPYKWTRRKSIVEVLA